MSNYESTQQSVVLRPEPKGKYIPPYKRTQDTSRDPSFDSRLSPKSRNFHQSKKSFETSDIVKPNRRHDLSQSKFNTRNESASRESPKGVRLIDVPIAVTPPIVEGPLATELLGQDDNEGNLTYNDVILQELNPTSIIPMDSGKQSPPLACSKRLWSHNTSHMEVLGPDEITILFPLELHESGLSERKQKYQSPTIHQEFSVETPNCDLRSQELRLIGALSNLRVKEKQEEKKRWTDHYEKELSDMYEACVDQKLGISFDDFVQTAYECTNSEYDKKSYKRIYPLL